MIAPNEHVAGKSAIYQLKVVLRDTSPPIWRRLQVPGTANLGCLHAVIQIAMGWTNSHLHDFVIGEERYSNPRHSDGVGFGEIPDLDEGKAKLTQVMPNEGSKCIYQYDFGDSWEHVIAVEKILMPDTLVRTVAICTGGKRACPPEDCGGVWGYANLLEALKNRKHRDHKHWKQWIGSFDAEAFDLESTNRLLQRLKWPRGTDAQLRKVYGFK